jgi:Gpi18-like mannosyltransferase
MRFALLVFLVSRLVITLWAVVVLAILPLPQEADEVLRPYLGQPPIERGLSALVLGPWQRFDALHYLRIAEDGYAAEEDSVFPPLYPAAINLLGRLLGLLLGSNGNLAAALIISNLAFLASLVLLYRLTEAELDEPTAKRSVVYWTIFPTAFFLLAAYTESLFLLLAMGSIWSARRDRFWLAGLLGLIAPLVRLTGWVLVVPLAYEYLARRDFNWRRIDWTGLATLLPLAGTSLFLLYRYLIGLPSLGAIYSAYWYQETTFPGHDLFTAIQQMIAGGAPFTLFFDFLCALLLLATTLIALRRLPRIYGLYSAMLLLFMLLPTSNLKPLYSFSRYTLAFFPTFMLLGQAGRRPWPNRLIVYPSVALYLYFSGQFFMWGWVA